MILLADRADEPAAGTCAGLLDGLPVNAHLHIRHAGGPIAPGPQWQLSGRLQDDHVAYFICGGRGTIFCGEGAAPVRVGMCVLASGRTSHSIRTDPESPLVFYPVHFRKALHAGADVSDLPPGRVYALGVPAECWSRLDDMILHQNSDSLSMKAVAASLLHAVLRHVHDDARYLLPASDEVRRLDELVLHLQKEPRRRWSVRELAAMAGMCRTRFIRAFRDRTGMPPGAYMIRERCRHASRLLKEGVSVKECAAACGYPDPFCFSKQFRKTMGVAPSREKGAPNA